MDDKSMRYEAIYEYNMDDLEAKAYRVYLIWLDRSHKMFPKYQHYGVKKGDPRKSLIFKVCYKLVRETAGILEESEYPLYVRAQLDILKHIENNNGNPLIDPNCLVGDKAWKRWKLWKRKFDAVSSRPSELPQNVGPGERKALEGFERTKEFIFKTLGPEPNIEKFREAYLNKNLFRWINFGKISPYYVSVSPYIEKIVQVEDFKKMNFDPQLYKPCITEDVMNKFKELFSYEFKDLQQE